MQSKIHEHNFCNKACTIAYLRSSQNTSMSKGWKHTEEAKEKIRQANLEKDYNVIFTKETRRKLAEGARKKVWTDESKEKLRQSNLGKKLSTEHKQKIKLHAKYGEDNKMYKEKPSNVAIHAWANRHLPLPKICVKFDPSGRNPCSKRIEASSKGNLHLREKTNWEWRCTRHHREYELRYGLVNPTGKVERMYRKFGNMRMRDITVDGIIVEKKEVTSSYL